jgi:hypothetical protein
VDVLVFHNDHLFFSEAQQEFHSSSTMSGASLGSMMQPEPNLIMEVPPAIKPMSTDVAEQAMQLPKSLYFLITSEIHNFKVF